MSDPNLDRDFERNRRSFSSSWLLGAIGVIAVVALLMYGGWHANRVTDDQPATTTSSAPGSGSSQPGTTGVGTGAETSTQTAPGNATRGPTGSQPAK